MAKRRQVSVFDRRYITISADYCVPRDKDLGEFVIGPYGTCEIKKLCDRIAQLQTVVENQKALLKKRNRA